MKPSLTLLTAFLFLVLTTACTKKSEEKETIVLKPSNNTTEIHFFGNSTLDQSNGLAPEIGAAAWTYLGEEVSMRAALKFDLSSIPANAEIVSAKLDLYSNPENLNGNDAGPNFGTNNAMLIQRATSSWDMYSSWAEQPSSINVNEIRIPHTNKPILDLLDIDVTAMVKDMAALGNYGFKIFLENEEAYNSRIFCSSKFHDSSKHPALEISYIKK